MRARILIIDDSEAVRQAARDILVQESFVVDVARTASDGLAIAQRQRPDLCLVDLSIRGMGGLGFCQAMAGDPVLRDTHIILLSAKGDPLAEELRPLIGQASLLDKPFTPEALKAAVIAHLRAPQALRVERDAALELRAWADRIATSAHGDRAKLLDDCLSFFGADAQAALSGNLAAVPLAELFQMLALQAQTGRLRVSGPELVVDVYLSDGRVDFVHAVQADPSLLLGRVLTNEGMLTPGDLELFLRYRRASRLMGQQLVLLGYLTTEEMRQALATQSSELVYALLRLRSGRFALFHEPEPSPLATEYRLDLGTEALLMEGYRRVDELSLIEAALGSDNAVPATDAAALARFGQSNLTNDEQAMLMLVDGRTPVVRIVERAPFGRFSALKALYRLREARLITLP